MPRLQIRNLPMRTDLRPRLGFFASSGMILILLVFYRSDLRSTVVRFQSADSNTFSTFNGRDRWTYGMVARPFRAKA